MTKQRTAHFTTTVTHKPTVKCDHCGAICTFRDGTYNVVTGDPIGRYVHPEPMTMVCCTADGYRRNVVLL